MLAPGLSGVLEPDPDAGRAGSRGVRTTDPLRWVVRLALGGALFLAVWTSLAVAARAADGEPAPAVSTDAVADDPEAGSTGARSDPPGWAHRRAPAAADSVDDVAPPTDAENLEEPSGTDPAPPAHEPPPDGTPPADDTSTGEEVDVPPADEPSEEPSTEPTPGKHKPRNADPAPDCTSSTPQGGSSECPSPTPTDPDPAPAPPEGTGTTNPADTSVPPVDEVPEGTEVAEDVPLPEPPVEVAVEEVAEDAEVVDPALTDDCAAPSLDLAVPSIVDLVDTVLPCAEPAEPAEPATSATVPLTAAAVAVAVDVAVVDAGWAPSPAPSPTAAADRSRPTARDTTVSENPYRPSQQPAPGAPTRLPAMPPPPVATGSGSGCSGTGLRRDVIDAAGDQVAVLGGAAGECVAAAGPESTTSDPAGTVAGRYDPGFRPD